MTDREEPHAALYCTDGGLVINGAHIDYWKAKAKRFANALHQIAKDGDTNTEAAVFANNVLADG